LNQTKKGKEDAVECLKVDKFPKTQKEANPKVEDKTSKEFWPSLDAF
jgi:hypothetical protein